MLNPFSLVVGTLAIRTKCKQGVSSSPSSSASTVSSSSRSIRRKMRTAVGDSWTRRMIRLLLVIVVTSQLSSSYSFVSLPTVFRSKQQSTTNALVCFRITTTTRDRMSNHRKKYGRYSLPKTVTTDFQSLDLQRSNNSEQSNNDSLTKRQLAPSFIIGNSDDLDSNCNRPNNAAMLSLFLRDWIGKAFLIALFVVITTLSTFNVGNSAALAIEATTPTISSATIATTSKSTATSNVDDSQTTVSTPTTTKRGQKYWTIQTDGTDDERIEANMALIDYIVGTVNTMYYDRTAGVQFTPSDYYANWRSWYKGDPTLSRSMLSTRDGTVSVIKTILFNAKSLPDPFAKYLTRDELYSELTVRSDGFLGLGAIVEIPGNNPFIEDTTSSTAISSSSDRSVTDDLVRQSFMPKKVHKVTESLSFIRYASKNKNYHTSSASTVPSSMQYLNANIVRDVPVITAVVPYSPAERAGLTVGDRIIAVQDDSFLSLSRQQVATKLNDKYSAEYNQYFGYTEITVAKPITLHAPSPTTTKIRIDNKDDEEATVSLSSSDVIQAFRPIRVRLPTVAASTTNLYNNNDDSRQDASSPFVATTNALAGRQEQSAISSPSSTATINNMDDSATISPQTTLLNGVPIDNINQNLQYISRPVLSGGNSVVRWQLLNDQGSIFIDKWSTIEKQQQEPQVDELERLISLNENEASHSDESSVTSNDSSGGGVGYIRLTRFSRSSTDGFINAVKELESLGATSYIVDLRNNYGGVVQSAMMLASSLLRDPHDVLCFTMNSRGGFTPHDVEEFVVDKNYPGYLLSFESSDVTVNQVKEENPSFFENNGWSPPSAYASLREQGVKRGIHKSSNRMNSVTRSMLSPAELIRLQQKEMQKPLVLLINEGTASSAEVFASALRDNGRTVALIGSKTYGKGLIQHTFPLPDGGGLRLTVAEYLTPSLQHVSRVGGAQFDPSTGEWVGGGIRPDIYCDSKQGIPNNIGADLCVGMALDALEEYEQLKDSNDEVDIENNSNSNNDPAGSTSGLLAVEELE